MNTVWLKIAAVVVVVAVAALLIHRVAIYKPKPAEPMKTIGDTFREDDKRLRADVPVQPTPEQPAAGQQAPVAQQPRFRQLTEDEEAGASQLFELAIAQRKMGRLPGVHYGAMVQYCRQILEKYPGSEYAYKAKRILADIPENERTRYHITDDEINPDK